MQATMTIVFRNLLQETKKSSNFFDFIEPFDSADEIVDVENAQRAQWNSKNINFFDFNHENKLVFINQTVKHFNKNIYYKNVHVFIEKIKKMTIVLKFEIVRKNLIICLKNTTLMWHTAELTDASKKLLTYDNDVNEWM